MNFQERLMTIGGNMDAKRNILVALFFCVLNHKMIVIHGQCNRQSYDPVTDTCGYSCSEQVSRWEFPELSNSLPHCDSFFFYLSNGNYHSFPAEFFTSVGHLVHFTLKLTDVTFAYFPSSKDTVSPFANVLFDVSSFIRLVRVRVLHEWNWRLFSQLAPAKGGTGTFRCYTCDVVHLDKDFSSMLNGSVMEVLFSEGKLKTLDDGVFATFLSLKEVFLHGNEIEEIKRNYFPIPAAVLQTIVLHNNKISHLPLNMFIAMPALNIVRLTGNPLTTLSETIFRPIADIAFLGVFDIPLHCDCRVRWIKYALVNSQHLQINDFECRTPERFRGLSLKNLTEDHLGC